MQQSLASDPTVPPVPTPDPDVPPPHRPEPTEPPTPILPDPLPPKPEPMVPERPPELPGSDQARAPRRIERPECVASPSCGSMLMSTTVNTAGS